jgi:hypothetical protein
MKTAEELMVCLNFLTVRTYDFSWEGVSISVVSVSYILQVPKFQKVYPKLMSFCSYFKNGEQHCLSMLTLGESYLGLRYFTYPFQTNLKYYDIILFSLPLYWFK